MINKQYSSETKDQYKAREWKDMGTTYVIVGRVDFSLPKEIKFLCKIYLLK